jgi:hypothetical protein
VLLLPMVVDAAQLPMVDSVVANDDYRLKDEKTINFLKKNMYYFIY